LAAAEEPGEQAGHAAALTRIRGRLAVELTLRQDARELRLRHARPMAHTAGIHMHEGRARGGIKADTAALRPQAGFAQLLERHAWNVEVDRLAQHVLAELGDSARTPP